MGLETVWMVKMRMDVNQLAPLFISLATRAHAFHNKKSVMARNSVQMVMVSICNVYQDIGLLVLMLLVLLTMMMSSDEEKCGAKEKCSDESKCEHMCVIEGNGAVSCQCRRGYKLAKNGYR